MFYSSGYRVGSVVKHGCHRTGKTWKTINFLRKSVKTWKIQGKMLKKYMIQGKIWELFWATLDNQHTCSEMGVAIKAWLLLCLDQ